MLFLLAGREKMYRLQLLSCLKCLLASYFKGIFHESQLIGPAPWARLKREMFLEAREGRAKHSSIDPYQAAA